MKRSVFRYFSLILMVVIIAACDTSSAKQTPANAKGDTLVRFIFVMLEMLDARYLHVSTL